MLSGLVLPACLIALCAVVIPRVVERRVPETLFGVALNALLSCALIWASAAGLFALLYALQGPTLSLLWDTAPGASLWHFARLGAMAALIWGPIAALVIGTSPGRWKVNTW